MSLDAEAVLKEIDTVFARFGASKDHPTPTVDEKGRVSVDYGRAATACLACIERNAPQPSYIRTARELMDGGRIGDMVIRRLFGILASIRDDIEAGFTKSLEVCVRETVFDDLLEMAERIADDYSPAPAVVLAVSVLEEHVRKLAEANGVDTIKTNGRFRSFEDITNDLGASPPDVFRCPSAGLWVRGTRSEPPPHMDASMRSWTRRSPASSTGYVDC